MILNIYKSLYKFNNLIPELFLNIRFFSVKRKNSVSNIFILAIFFLQNALKHPIKEPSDGCAYANLQSKYYFGQIINYNHVTEKIKINKISVNKVKENSIYKFNNKITEIIKK